MIKNPIQSIQSIIIPNITKATRKAVDDFAVKTPALSTMVKNLSGGNVQKLIMARELTRKSESFDRRPAYPRVDVGATEYIHRTAF